VGSFKERDPGGYRYIVCSESICLEDDCKHLATAELFHFTEKFRKEYMPHMIELGRSFVQPSYQTTSRNSKGLYALDNLWDGLGAILDESQGRQVFLWQGNHVHSV